MCISVSPEVADVDHDFVCGNHSVPSPDLIGTPEKMNAVSLISLGLATYRATRLVTTDTIADPIREKIWDKHPPEDSKLGYILTCNWCTSIWVAASLLTLRAVSPTSSKAVEGILAGSAIAGLLSTYEDRM